MLWHFYLADYTWQFLGDAALDTGQRHIDFVIAHYRHRIYFSLIHEPSFHLKGPRCSSSEPLVLIHLTLVNHAAGVTTEWLTASMNCMLWRMIRARGCLWGMLLRWHVWVAWWIGKILQDWHDVLTQLMSCFVSPRFSSTCMPSTIELQQWNPSKPATQ